MPASTIDGMFMDAFDDRYEPGDEDDGFEAFITDLVERKNRATGAELVLIKRQIEGVRGHSERAHNILETLDEWLCTSDDRPPPAEKPEGRLIHFRVPPARTAR